MAAGRTDVALAGVGLANALLAVRLRALRPDLRVEAFEAADVFGAGRTWSFFASDLTAAEAAWMQPFVGHAWPGYRVMFPGFERTLSTPYRTLSTPAIGGALRTALGEHVSFGTALSGVAADHVVGPGGIRTEAAAVVDGRGSAGLGALRCGWQKFLGQEVRLAAPHGLDRPILMDARVEQRGGFRFIYVLPFAPDRLLIEDTRYSLSRSLETADYRDGIARYAEAAGWTVAETLGEEQGVLPVVMDGDIDALLAGCAAAPVGVRSGMFHPVTSYSLPSAVATADALAAAWPDDAAALRRVLAGRARTAWAGQGFYRLLNRMLFLAGEPEERWRVFRRFYSLSQPLIERFYAGRCTWADKVRVLAGRPPVPLLPAIRCIPAGRSFQTERVA